MTKDYAIGTAQRISQALSKPMLVVFDPTVPSAEYTNDFSFFVCAVDELDGYFLGAQVIYSTEG